MNRTSDQFINSGGFCWFVGVVEDVNDPKTLNRVRVRCFGYHTDDTSKVQTSDLPWATVMMPTTSASYKGVGSNHELMVGSWVIGFFRDGSSAQDPIVMGSIATETDGVTDIPEAARLNPPQNKVHQTESGHRIELDNTSGSERIQITHKSGSKITMDENGNVSIIGTVIYLNGEPQ
jgi:hypothetical protein